jgi:plasmid stability protein
MPTRERLVSIVVDRELHGRIRAEAARQRKSVSAFVRDMLEERLRPRSRRPTAGSALLRLCGLAHGELSGTDVDRELYGG